MSREHAVPVVSMVGKPGVGKTTALQHIIRELERSGCRTEKREIVDDRKDEP